MVDTKRDCKRQDLGAPSVAAYRDHVYNDDCDLTAPRGRLKGYGQG